MSEHQVIRDTRERFEKTLAHLQEQLKAIRTGRASSALVDNIRVDYYGAATPLSQLAAISVPEARQIAIKPFDPSIVKEVVKAVAKADFGGQPQDDGKVIRINLPALSGEQREKYAAKVKEICEEARVAMRNTRRDMNKVADGATKSGGLTEDEGRKLQESVQDLLKDWEAKVDQVYKKKVEEIRE